MAFTITLKAGHVITVDTPITVETLNELFSLGYGEVVSGSIETADIADEAVTLAKMADLARGSIISGQTANNRPTVLDAKTDGYILVGDGTDVSSVALSGDVVVSGTGVATVQNTFSSFFNHNLVVTNNSATPNTKIDVTADELTVENASGQRKLVASVSTTIDTSTVGADGIDNGTQAASTWYYVWVIHDPDTPATAGLISTSESSPTLPSGYTYKRLVGEVYSDASIHFIEHRRDGQQVWFAEPQEVWESTFPAYASPTERDVSAIIPSGCTGVHLEGGTTSASATDAAMVISPDSTRKYATTYASADAATTSVINPTGLFLACPLYMKNLGGTSLFVSGTTAGTHTNQGLWLWGYELSR